MYVFIEFGRLKYNKKLLIKRSHFLHIYIRDCNLNLISEDTIKISSLVSDYVIKRTMMIEITSLVKDKLFLSIFYLNKNILKDILIFQEQNYLFNTIINFDGVNFYVKLIINVYMTIPLINRNICLLNNNAPLFIGHRGAGSNNSNSIFIEENTIESINHACKLGLKCVEFDVQITKDQNVVLYHDWKLDNVFIHQLTYEEFKKKFSEHMHYTVGTPTTLYESFSQIQYNIPYDIEIKYPLEKEILNNETEVSNWPSLDFYVDLILDLANPFFTKRFIFFSSFHPEICSYIKNKGLPAFLLLSPEYFKLESFKDALKSAMFYCLVWKIDGIIFDSKFIDNTSKGIIEFIRSKGLYVLTYGLENNQREKISNMLKLVEIDGIISDSVFTLSSKS